MGWRKRMFVLQIKNYRRDFWSSQLLHPGSASPYACIHLYVFDNLFFFMFFSCMMQSIIFMYELLITVLTFDNSMMMDMTRMFLVHHNFWTFRHIDHIHFSCDETDPLIQRGRRYYLALMEYDLSIGIAFFFNLIIISKYKKDIIYAGR